MLAAGFISLIPRPFRGGRSPKEPGYEATGFINDVCPLTEFWYLANSHTWSDVCYQLG